MKRPLSAATLVCLVLLGVQPLSAQAAGSAGSGGSVLTSDQRAKFLAYVERHHPPFSFIDSYGLKIGQAIKDTGISYYRMPAGLGLNRFRYTIINNQIVIVDAKTHRVTDLIE